MIAAITPVTLKPGFNITPQGQPATWEDYLTYRDKLPKTRVKLHFAQTRLLIETGRERIIYSDIKDLLTMMLGLWFSSHPELTFCIFGECQLEKPETQAISPDLVLYLGENYPRKLPKNKRYINLDKFRVPALAVEIADPILGIDLLGKKHLYEELVIPEYWLVNINTKKVRAFRLQEDKTYQEINISVALAGLPIELLDQTLSRINQGKTGSAATWFSQEILNILIGG